MENIVPTSYKKLKNYIYSINPKISYKDYNIEKESFKKLRYNDLPYIYNLDHLANICEISSSQLSLFVHNKTKSYVSFKIPKRNGTFREISAPTSELKFVQRWILYNILYNLDPGKYSHGFIPKRSIITNASVHVGNELVLCIDLKNFFPNIKMNRIVGLFNGMGYTKKTSILLAEICTYNWALPQGSPTSPMLSNLIAWHLDFYLSHFCEKYNLNYSRYADDITISGSKILPRYKTLIFHIIERQGFEINYDKVRLHDQGSSQRVTGLVVNEKISIQRKKKRLLRAMVHNILKNGPIAENRTNDPFFREKIFGLLGFAKMVNPEFAISLLDKLETVDWSELDGLKKVQFKENLDLRLLKESHIIIADFNNLEIFKNVCELSEVEWTEDFNKHIDDLREKCPDQTEIECSNCLHLRKDDSKYCIKHILGFFVQNTCGTHHGHEICDLISFTKYNDIPVIVAFIAKSGKMSTSQKDTLLRQVFENTARSDINIISIVTNYNLDTKLRLDLVRMIKLCSDDQLGCFIMRNEIGQILVTYKKINNL
jgi:RNA-directed DNA polymerase